MGLVGFTKTLAREGAKYGIKATVIAPIAASAMTETIMPPEMLANLKPEFVAPFVAAVTHPDGPDASGRLFEIGAGWMAEVRWERGKGTVFKTDASFTPSAVSTSHLFIFIYRISCIRSPKSGQRSLTLKTPTSENLFVFRGQSRR
jgi:multifunctional beta-oxidation protein